MEIIGKFSEPSVKDFVPKTDWLPDSDDGVFANFYKGLTKQFLGVAKGVTGTVESGVESIFGENETLSKITQNIRNSQMQFETTPDNSVEWVASILGQAIPYMGASMVTGAGGGMLAGKIGQWIGSAAIGFMVEGQDAYDTAKKRGASETQAESERLLVGTINAFIEASQAGKLLRLKDTGKHSLKGLISNIKSKAYKNIGGDLKKFGAAALRTSVNEGFEEFLQEGVSTLVPGLIEGKKGLPLDANGKVDFVTIATRMSTAALAGGIASPILGAAGSILPGRGYGGLTANVGLPSAEVLDTSIKQVQESNLPTLQKQAEIDELTAAKRLVTGEKIETVEGVAEETNLHKRLLEKLTYLDETIRPISQKEIKQQRGIKSGEYNDYYNELVKSGVDSSVAHIRAMSRLKGQMVSSFPSLLKEGFTEEDLNGLITQAHNSGFYKTFENVRVNEALGKLFNKKGDAVLPEPAEIALLEPILGKNVTQKLQDMKKKTRTLGQKAVSEILDVANLPRAILASWDFSAPGRQGLLIAFQNPKAWTKGLFAGYRAFANKNFANMKMTQIKTNDFYPLAKKSGIFEATLGGGKTAEEPFVSTLADEIPLVGRSERAYVTALNVMRFESFYRVCEDWAGTGKTEKDYRNLGSIINHMTGRGDLGGLEKLASSLNVLFFSPRLQMARIQTITDLITKDGESRKILAATLTKALATGASLLGLAYLLSKKNKDVSVEFNPKSSDFGKIKFGNTRIDYWGGYSQLIRTMVQLGSGEIKSAQTGEKYDETTLNIFGRFLQTKLSPAAGYAVDVYRGEDFKGDIVSKENAGEQFYERFTPLFVQDCVDALRYQGFTGLALTAPLASHGIGVMTYPKSKSAQSRIIKNNLSQENFGTNWDSLGPDFQKALRENYPLIQHYESVAKSAKLSKQADARFIREQRSSERTLRKTLGKEITDPLDRAFVNIGGFSRKIGTDWYLNDIRYKEYQMRTAIILKEILPNIVNKRMPEDVKRLLVEDIVNTVKNNVRQNLMDIATIDDIKRLQ